jgi:hypothetical protein
VLPSLFMASMSEPARKHACTRRYAGPSTNDAGVVEVRRVTAWPHLQAAHVAVHGALHQQRVTFVVSGIGAHTRGERLSQLLVVTEPAHVTEVNAKHVPLQ